MAARPVDNDVCLERHKAIDEKCVTLFRNQDEFFDSLGDITRALTSFSASQTEINGQIMKHLRELNDSIRETNKRVKDLEDAPKVKWNQAVSIIMQFVILLVLGLIVAKVGF